MTRSTSLFCLALALGASVSAQAQVLPDRAQADTKKPASAAKVAPKAAAAAAKDVRTTAPTDISGATKAVAPASMRSTSPGKDGDSGCHSKNSDA